jgi:flavin reductase (DIM6/NTAB) family NADH-FMN oxidoreductase RutF
MKIDPKDLGWNKAHDILTDIVTPRPIALVSTIGSDGIYNVAPYSYFTAMCNLPMIVGFSVGTKSKGRKKDTLINIESTNEFVVAVVTEAIAEPMNKTAIGYPIEVDEFEKADLTPVKADIVKPRLVGESPINLECKFLQVLKFGTDEKFNYFVIGEVIRIHVKDECCVDDQIQASRLKIIGRLGGGGNLYCRTSDILKITRIH